MRAEREFYGKNTSIDMAAIVDAVLNAAFDWRRGSCAVSDVHYVHINKKTPQHPRTGEGRIPVNRTPAHSLHVDVPLPDTAFRIVVISDTHDAHRSLAIPTADVLIHAGDVQLCSSRFSAAECERKLQDFNAWLGSLNHVTHKVVIGGNHDGYLEKIGPVRAKQLLSNAHFLVFEDVVLPHPRYPDTTPPLHVYGAPFSEGTSRNSAYQLRGHPETMVDGHHHRRIPPSRIPALRRVMEATPSIRAVDDDSGATAAAVQDSGVDHLDHRRPLYDICVTHSPFMGRLQLDPGRNEADALRTALNWSSKLADDGHVLLGRMHVGGHLHSQYGAHLHHRIVNLVGCSVDQRYRPVNPPLVVDVEPPTSPDLMCVAATHHRLVASSSSSIVAGSSPTPTTSLPQLLLPQAGKVALD